MSRASIARDRGRLDELVNEKIPGAMAEKKAIGKNRSDELARFAAQEGLDLLLMEQSEIRSRLDSAEVAYGSEERVEIGSTVTFVYIQTRRSYTLTVISTNGNVREDGTTSTDSLVGEALMGAKLGDVVTVRLDSGAVEEIEVTDIFLKDN